MKDVQEGEWGAQWVQHTMKFKGRLLTQGERRVANMLHHVFYGVYHVAGSISRGKWEGDYVQICLSSIGATVDFNTLTRLVVAAHDFGVRLEISPASSHYLRLEMWPRSRSQKLTQGHPTMERALAKMKRPEPWWDEIEVPV